MAIIFRLITEKSTMIGETLDILIGETGFRSICLKYL
jgi:hypothetical protein